MCSSDNLWDMWGSLGAKTTELRAEGKTFPRASQSLFSLIVLASESRRCHDCHDSLLQGWVCPGLLVIAGPSESLAAVETAWAAHSLQPPDNFRILNVGLSHSCSLKPFKQVTGCPL